MITNLNLWLKASLTAMLVSVVFVVVGVVFTAIDPQNIKPFILALSAFVASALSFAVACIAILWLEV